MKKQTTKSTKEKPECRLCKRNLVRHGLYGCFRAWVKGGPANCIDYERTE